MKSVAVKLAHKEIQKIRMKNSLIRDRKKLVENLRQWDSKNQKSAKMVGGLSQKLRLSINRKVSIAERAKSKLQMSEIREQEDDDSSSYCYDDELDEDPESDQEQEESSDCTDDELPLELQEIVEINEKEIIEAQYKKIQKSAIFESFIPKENFFETPTKAEFK